ncbi:hypothetical protein ACIOWI_36855 [Streptomyces sp. NPDC087659]
MTSGTATLLAVSCRRPRRPCGDLSQYPPYQHFQLKHYPPLAPGATEDE